MPGKKKKFVPPSEIQLRNYEAAQARRKANPIRHGRPDQPAAPHSAFRRTDAPTPVRSGTRRATSPAGPPKARKSMPGPTLVLDGNIKHPKRPSRASFASPKPPGYNGPDTLGHPVVYGEGGVQSLATRRNVIRGVKGTLIGAGVAGATGGAYAAVRHRRKEMAVKNYVDPFNDVVVFGKAYPVKDVTAVRSASPMRPTGRGVGHGLRLKEVHNSKGKGGKRAGLERYTGKHASQRVGPFKGKHTDMNTKFGKALIPVPGANLNKIKSAATMMPKARLPLPPSSATKPTRSIGAMPLSGAH